MNKVGFWAAAAWLTASACGAAGGTETDNPAATLKDFSSSACKNRELNEGQQGLALESNTDGLQCVAWQAEGDALTVQLANFPEPCGDRYLGKAEAASDALRLSVYKDTCTVLRCGTCVFDFNFTLRGVSRSAPLRLELGSAVCETEPTSFSDQVTLPLDEQASGVVCRPLRRNVAEQYGSERDACGQLNMPCGDCQSADMTSCAAGLSCTDIGDGDYRCLGPCEADDECVGGLTSCDAGLCRAGSF